MGRRRERRARVRWPMGLYLAALGVAVAGCDFLFGNQTACTYAHSNMLVKVENADGSPIVGVTVHLNGEPAYDPNEIQSGVTDDHGYVLFPSVPLSHCGADGSLEASIPFVYSLRAEYAIAGGCVVLSKEFWFDPTSNHVTLSVAQDVCPTTASDGGLATCSCSTGP